MNYALDFYTKKRKENLLSKEDTQILLNLIDSFDEFCELKNHIIKNGGLASNFKGFHSVILLKKKELSFEEQK